MNKAQLMLVISLAIASSGCGKQKMLPVPPAGTAAVPCSSLTPWGFPQTENVAIPGEKVLKNQPSSVGFLCKKGLYAIGYDQNLRVPRWAMEVVSPKNWQGPNQKVRKDWRPDPFVPSASGVQLSDYTKEITQGKISVKAMVSNKDYANSEILIGRTFYLSNSAPAIKKDQAPGAWERLEDQVVAWSGSKGDLLVISGTVFAGGSPLGWAGHVEKRRGGKDPRGVIAIPTHFYKVIVDLQSKQAIAFLVPNNDSPASSLPAMAKRISDVEKISGIQFFPAMPPEDRARVVDRVAVEQWALQ